MLQCGQEVVSLRTTSISTSIPRTEDPTDLKFCMHTHERYELYLFLSGDVEFFVEGTVYTPAPGDILLLKKAEAHAMMAKSAAPYERMVVHFDTDALVCDKEEAERIRAFLDDRPLGCCKPLSTASQEGTGWLYYMRCLCSTKDISRKRIYLTVLLHELSRSGADGNDPGKRDSVSTVIQYINANLTQPLSLELLCEKFFFSKAQLNRRFKRVTGTTVWDYILTKRLFLARALLRAGEAPSMACSKSGFRDYCTFYRAYKSRFGCPPRADTTPPQQP